MKDKKNKVLVSILSIVGLLLVIGVSYAYFGYFERGEYELSFEGGKLDVLFTSVTGDNVTLEGMYPMTDADGLLNGITYDFNITGYNESKKDIHYRLYMEDNASIEGKSRFYDDDIRIAVYKNGEEVLKPSTIEDFYDPGYYFDVIPKGTSVDNPVSHNYTVKVWIGDHVRITDTVCEEGYTCYSQDDYKNLFFGKIMKVEADFSYDDLGYLTYNTMGGLYQPEKTSVSTQTVTAQKPVMEGKGFLGWSSDSRATEVEYYAGDTYTGVGKTLYAVYSDTRNVMGTFPEEILNYAVAIENGDINEKSYNGDNYQLSPIMSAAPDYSGIEGITKIYFINDKQEKIDARYNNAEIKADITLNNQGKVLAWLETNAVSNNLGKEYTLYIGAEGTIYFSDCVLLFSPFVFCRYIDLCNVDSLLVNDMTGMFSLSASGDINPSAYGNDEYEIKPVESEELLDNYILIIDNLSSQNTMNVVSMEGMFYNAPVYELTLEFDTSKVENMSYMFANCEYLNELNLEKLDTSNVKNMEGMFDECYSLVELDLSNFNTGNVTDMSYMFNCCENLTSLNLTNFNTSNVTDMSYMFNCCENLTSLNLTNFNTSNVTNMSYMFMNCYNLASLDISNFNTSNVTNMHYMFYDCSNLKTLKLTEFNTANVTDMEDMFYNCNKLEKLNLDKFNTSKTDTAWNIFYNCTNLTEVSMKDAVITENGIFTYIRTSIKTLDLTNATLIGDMYRLFSGCSLLENLILDNINTTQVVSMREMFYLCDSLVKLDLSKWDTSNVVNMDNFITGCEGLTEVNLSNLDMTSVDNEDTPDVLSGCDNVKRLIATNSIIKTSKFTWGINDSVEFIDISNSKLIGDVSGMFSSCEFLTTLNLENVDTSEVTDMSSMFSGCSGLLNIDLSSFDTSNVVDMSYMFSSCSNLIKLDLSNLDTSKVTNMYGMFSSCKRLLSLNLSNFDTSQVTKMSHMFSNCNVLKNLNTLGFDTSKVTDMTYMFYNCSSLETLDLSHFDTESVTDMALMFMGCTSLIKLNLSGFKTSKLEDMYGMFWYCSKLETLDLSSFDTSNVTRMSYMLRECSGLKQLDLSSFIFNDTLTGESSNYTDIFNAVGRSGECIVYVKSSTEQSWILSLSGGNCPSTWTTSNVIVKTA